MRIAAISLFIMLFTGFLGALNAVNFGGGVSVEGNLSIQIANITINGTESTFPWLSTLITPLKIFTEAVKAAFLLGYYIKSLIPIIPDELAGVLTVGVDFMYAVGVIQLLSGRAFKTMR